MRELTLGAHLFCHLVAAVADAAAAAAAAAPDGLWEETSWTEEEGPPLMLRRSSRFSAALPPSHRAAATGQRHALLPLDLCPPAILPRSGSALLPLAGHFTSFPDCRATKLAARGVLRGPSGSSTDRSDEDAGTRVVQPVSVPNEKATFVLTRPVLLAPPCDAWSRRQGEAPLAC